MANEQALREALEKLLGSLPDPDIVGWTSEMRGAIRRAEAALAASEPQTDAFQALTDAAKRIHHTPAISPELVRLKDRNRISEPQQAGETSAPVGDCPQCHGSPFFHDNSTCPYRFAPTICEWIKLPQYLAELATPKPGGV